MSTNNIRTTREAHPPVHPESISKDFYEIRSDDCLYDHIPYLDCDSSDDPPPRSTPTKRQRSKSTRGKYALRNIVQDFKITPGDDDDEGETVGGTIQTKYGEFEFTVIHSVPDATNQLKGEKGVDDSVVDALSHLHPNDLSASPYMVNTPRNCIEETEETAEIPTDVPVLPSNDEISPSILRFIQTMVCPHPKLELHKAYEKARKIYQQHGYELTPAPPPSSYTFFTSHLVRILIAVMPPASVLSIVESTNKYNHQYNSPPVQDIDIREFFMFLTIIFDTIGIGFKIVEGLTNMYGDSIVITPTRYDEIRQMIQLNDYFIFHKKAVSSKFDHATQLKECMYLFQQQFVDWTRDLFTDVVAVATGGSVLSYDPYTPKAAQTSALHNYSYAKLSPIMLPLHTLHDASTKMLMNFTLSIDNFREFLQELPPEDSNEPVLADSALVVDYLLRGYEADDKGQFLVITESSDEFIDAMVAIRKHGHHGIVKLKKTVSEIPSDYLLALPITHGNSLRIDLHGDESLGCSNLYVARGELGAYPCITLSSLYTDQVTVNITVARPGIRYLDHVIEEESASDGGGKSRKRSTGRGGGSGAMNNDYNNVRARAPPKTILHLPTHAAHNMYDSAPGVFNSYLASSRVGTVGNYHSFRTFFFLYILNIFAVQTRLAYHHLCQVHNIQPFPRKSVDSVSTYFEMLTNSMHHMLLFEHHYPIRIKGEFYADRIKEGIEKGRYRALVNKPGPGDDSRYHYDYKYHNSLDNDEEIPCSSTTAAIKHGPAMFICSPCAITSTTDKRELCEPCIEKHHDVNKLRKKKK